VIGRKTTETLLAGEYLRPLKDHIVVKPLQWEPSKILEVIRYGRPLRGIVKAVGPGSHFKIYKRNDQGQKTSFRYSKAFRPCDVKVGDIVELGGLNAFDGAGYAFTEILIENESHIVCQEQDVACVCG
jgi:co-chaperonin GroES (HSP10)